MDRLNLTRAYCIDCGYDLRACLGHCSECGRCFDMSDPQTYRRSNRTWARRFLFRLACAGLIVLVLSIAAGAWVYLGWQREQEALRVLSGRYWVTHTTSPIGGPRLHAWFGTRGLYLGRVRELHLMGLVSEDDLNRLRRFGFVEVLWLEYSSNTTDDSLAIISRMSSLRELHIRQGTMHERGIGYLAKLPRLRKLDFSEVRLSTEAFMSLRRCPQLEHLCIYWTGLGSKDIAAFLKQNPRIKAMDMFWTDISIEELVSLCDEFPNVALPDWMEWVRLLASRKR